MSEHFIPLELVDEVLADPPLDDPHFERIMSIVTIARRWGRGDRMRHREFARAFFWMLSETAKVHGFDTIDAYLNSTLDEGAAALWFIMVALADDEIGRRVESIVPADRHRQYTRTAEAAPLVAPDRMERVKAETEMLLELAVK